MIQEALDALPETDDPDLKAASANGGDHQQVP
jgi:hypothetical protein